MRYDAPTWWPGSRGEWPAGATPPREPCKAVFQAADGWYHTDETYASCFGPFRTRWLAETACQEYGESL